MWIALIASFADLFGEVNLHQTVATCTWFHLLHLPHNWAQFEVTPNSVPHHSTRDFRAAGNYPRNMLSLEYSHEKRRTGRNICLVIRLAVIPLFSPGMSVEHRSWSSIDNDVWIRGAGSREEYSVIEQNVLEIGFRHTINQSLWNCPIQPCRVSPGYQCSSYSGVNTSCVICTIDRRKVIWTIPSREWHCQRWGCVRLSVRSGDSWVILQWLSLVWQYQHAATYQWLDSMQCRNSIRTEVFRNTGVHV
jgi:hypothetical protein